MAANKESLFKIGQNVLSNTVNTGRNLLNKVDFANIVPDPTPQQIEADYINRIGNFAQPAISKGSEVLQGLQDFAQQSVQPAQTNVMEQGDMYGPQEPQQQGFLRPLIDYAKSPEGAQMIADTLRLGFAATRKDPIVGGAIAKGLTKARKQGYLDGKLGMIIDGTGSKFQKIKKQKKELEKQGYDCYMVFVETSLEVAQKRNQERSRVLDPNIVKKSWISTRKNLGAFKSLFKGNFALVNNDNFLNPKEAKHKFGGIVKGYAHKWASEPIKNPIGQKWVKDQLKIKNVGIK